MKHNYAFWNLFGKRQGKENFWRNSFVNQFREAPTIEYEKLHTRLSVPVACLIFGIIGAPLGIRRSRSGSSAGIVVAMGVFLVYHVLIGAGKNLAEAGTISVAAAYWIPNGIMAAATGVLIGLRGHEITLGVGDGIATVFRRLRKKTVFID